MPNPDNCFHCSEPLPRHNPREFSATIASKEHFFCCPACRVVAETIHHLGLQQYYQQRDQKPQNPIGKINATQEYADMDFPAYQKNFIHDGEDCEAQFFIPDIHCASCCWLIEKRLSSMDGIKTVYAQLSSHKLSLRWQKNVLQTSQIFAALASIGYRALPWQPTEQQEHTRRQQKQLLQRIGVTGLLAMQIHMIAMGHYFGASEQLQQWMNGVALLLSLPIWFYAATPFFSSAWRNLKVWHAGMDLPVAIAISAAAIASVIGVLQKTDNLYFDSIGMFVFLLLGARYLETQARGRLAAFTQQPVFPHSCTRLEDGIQTRIALYHLQMGDLVWVDTGVMPVDGVVINGTARVEQAMLTGEFFPVQKKVGDKVLAGSRLLRGSITVRAQAWGENSHLAQLHQRMENALAKKHSATLYDKLALWFTPLVLFTAAGSGLFWYWIDPAKALPAFLAVLVASCPCALSLAMPTALTAATLQLRRRGILVTSAQALATLPKIACFIFDKTGTLTQGRMRILHTQTHGKMLAEDCLLIAATLERDCTHPIASAFANSPMLAASTASKKIEHLHSGITATINGISYHIGKPPKNSNTSASDNTDIQVALSTQEALLATFTLGDSLRLDAADCIAQLQKVGLRCVLLSGDHSNAVETVAKELGITDLYKACSPAQKVAVLEKLKKQYGVVAMVGDGINDGPVLACANVSITLAEASQTAQLAADVLLLNNRLSDLLILRSFALRTRSVIRQNVGWALLYNLSILPIAAAGLLPPVAAAMGMALSSLLVTVNALRLFRDVKIIESS